MQMATNKQGRVRWPFLNAAVALVLLTAAYLRHECAQFGRQVFNLVTGRQDALEDSTRTEALQKSVKPVEAEERSSVK